MNFDYCVAFMGRDGRLYMRQWWPELQEWSIHKISLEYTQEG